MPFPYNDLMYLPTYVMLRELLFSLPSETSHAVALAGLSSLARTGLSEPFFGTPPSCEVELLGLKFRNPVGLAAGLDKDGVAVLGLAATGFGFIEVGTVTPKPQKGSSQPRLFRLREDRALVNRMGFNNLGVAHLVRRLEAARSRLPEACPIGINIGMNRDTPAHRSIEDYVECARKVAAVADYITLNVSSPNTPGLRDLQRIEALVPLLGSVRDSLEKAPKHPPLLVKVSPDLAEEDLIALAEVLKSSGADGVIATNTTISRPENLASRHRMEQGGLSGEPLFERSLQTVELLASHLQGLPIIACGGIHDAGSARRMMRAGASLLQIYTGFIYEGPMLIRNISQALRSDSNQSPGLSKRR